MLFQSMLFVVKLVYYYTVTEKSEEKCIVERKDHNPLPCNYDENCSTTQTLSYQTIRKLLECELNNNNNDNNNFYLLLTTTINNIKNNNNNIIIRVEGPVSNVMFKKRAGVFYRGRKLRGKDEWLYRPLS